MVQAKSATSSRRMNEIGDESRQRLLDAAESLFLEKGFEATTVVEIGKRAGISHGSIPWHFGNKSGILFAVVSRLFDKTAITEDVEVGQPGFNALWHEQTYYDDASKFSLFGASFLAEIEKSGAHRLEMMSRHGISRDIIISWINRSVAAESLVTQLPAEEIVEFWIGASRGMTLQKIVLLDEFDLPGARRGLGLALDSLLGSSYFRNLDSSL